MAALSIRQRIRDSALSLADIGGALLSGSGAAVVAFTGRLMLAVVLGAIALGFFLRLAGRRKVAAAPRPALPIWTRLLAGTLACVEAAVLTEATNLPVRFHQQGFAMWHWALVLAAVGVAYVLHMRLFVEVLRRSVRREPGTAVERV